MNDVFIILAAGKYLNECLSLGGLYMNKRAFYIYVVVSIIGSMLLNITSCIDPVIKIEDKNNYSWQKYMNEQEFNLLQDGMSYMEAVEIAGGAGKEKALSVYEWSDEMLLTQSYEVTFRNDKLVRKQIIDKRGYSTR